MTDAEHFRDALEEALHEARHDWLDQRRGLEPELDPRDAYGDEHHHPRVYETRCSCGVLLGTDEGPDCHRCANER